MDIVSEHLTRAAKHVCRLLVVLVCLLAAASFNAKQAASLGEIYYGIRL